MSRSRNWCFTLNNPTAEELAIIKAFKYTYIIIGNETGENNTPHYQGYIEFSVQRTLTSIKKDLGRAHLELAKGNGEHNKAYCSKQEILFEDGTIKRQGKRNDIERIRDAVEDGANMRAVVALASSTQAIRIAELYLNYNEEKRNWLPIVKWYYGATGTGKSRTAYAELEDPFTAGATSKWWQGYDAHENVIIDDFRKSFISFSELLRLLDAYPYLVECKGGSRQFLARQIIITSPFHPEEIFRDNLEDIGQLIRRITEIKCFNNI